MRKIVSVAGLAVLACLCARPTWAMGGPEDQGEDIFNLGEVMVSAEPDRIESGETVHVITEEEIKKSNARTIDDALQLLSDVNVQTGNEGVPRVEIRGFKTRDVLLLLDGIPMNSAFDNQFNAADIPVENISQIKVIAGASSVLYGQGGLGGVINIITKKGKKGLAGSVTAESGDGQPYYAKGTLSGGRGMFDFFASGSVFRRDHFPVARNFTASLEEASGFRKNSDSTRNSAFFNVNMTPNNDLTLGLTASWSQGGYGKPASAINDGFDPYAPRAKFGRVDYFQKINLQLSAEYAPARPFSARGTLYYNLAEEDNNQYDDENYGEIALNRPPVDQNGKVWFWLVDSVDRQIANSFKLRNKGETRGISLQPKYDIGRAGTLTAALKAEWLSWEGKGLVKPGGQGGSGGGSQGGFGIGGGSPPYWLNPVHDTGDVYIYSTSLEYSVGLSDKWGLAVGAGYDWQRQGGNQTTLSGPRDLGPRDPTVTGKTLEDYRVSLSTSYDLTSNTRLKAAFMRNIRFPSLSQLYLRDTNNPDLIQETAYQYQLGMEQKLPRNTMWQVNGFRSDLHDFIAINQNVIPAKNWNFSLYRFFGVETHVESRFVPRLRLKAGYTYLRSEDRSGVDRDEVQYTPRDKVTFVGTYDFDFGLTPYISAVYAANSYVYTKQRVATVSKKKMADYAVVNVKLTQKLFKNRFEIYVGAENLFNEDYEQSYGVPRPGRFIYGGAEYHFNL